MNDRSEGSVLKWLNKITTCILFTVLIGGLILVVSSKLSNGEPSIFGYQLKIVLSGSMEPDIQTGSVIAVKLGGDMSRFREGDVITFQEENQNIVTHRISEVLHSGGNVLYRTKGDNNDGVDLNPVLPENIVAEYTGFTIPYAGYAIGFLQSKNGALAIIFVGFLLLFYSMFSVWRVLANVEILREVEDGK